MNVMILGTGFGHLALGVNDIYAVCAELEKQGAKIPRPPGPMQHGTTHIAFIEDPDGYKIELIGLDTMWARAFRKKKKKKNRIERRGVSGREPR